MMNTKFYLLIFLLSVSITTAQTKKQEIVLLGTMHSVPKIVKKSYQPMFKRAKRYQPQAIYVESPMAHDSLSWNYLKTGWSKNYQRFYRLSDSLQKNFALEGEKFNGILKKNLSEMTPEDLNYLITCFAYKRDNGNFEYYTYLLKHGINGSKRPTRHEDGDLTYKLALALKHKYVYNMDDQQTNKEYHQGWQQCVREGVANGNNKILNALNKKDYRAAMIPAIFRGLGKHTNQRKSLNRLHKQSSFTYVKTDTPGCLQGRQFWNERNERMALNIGKQVLQSGDEKNLVIVGAAHIIGLEQALQKHFPNLSVKLAYE